MLFNTGEGKKLGGIVNWRNDADGGLLSNVPCCGVGWDTTCGD